MNSIESPAFEFAGEMPTPDLPRSVGSILRAAREAQGIGIADVADILRFSARQIEAVEADRYDLLPGATFVRGLVRGYSKFLKIDGEALVARLEVAVPAPVSDVRPPTTIAEASSPEADLGALTRRVVSALAIVLLALAGLYFFVDSTTQEIDPVAPAPAMGIAVMPAPGVSEPVMPPVAQADAEPKAVETAAAATSTEPVAPPMSAPLVVEFDDRSWIEVKDARQSIVLSGEFSKGVRQEVAGNPPFQLWIGRASAVRVNYKGVPVDIKTRTREDVARLTVE